VFVLDSDMCQTLARFRLEVSVLHSSYLRCYNKDFDFCVDEE